MTHADDQRHAANADDGTGGTAGEDHGGPAGSEETGRAGNNETGRAGSNRTDQPGSERSPQSGPPSAERRAGNGQPAGELYDWYRRGMHLLDGGDAAAAAQLLRHAAEAEPTSRSIREGLARAEFDAGQYPAARAEFRTLLEANPDDDYAHFGYGLACWRLGDLPIAAEHLAMAVAMRPTAKHYADALRQVRATLRARK